MNFLHEELELTADDVVEVELDHPANVCLLDDANFEKYQRRAEHKYQGGHATKSPVRLTPPTGGRWHVVIDLGGHGGKVAARVNVISRVNA
jgi:hypothetical protein